MMHQINWRKPVFAFALIFFIAIIFLPAVFILGGIFQGEMSLDWTILRAVFLSFFIGLAVVVIDLLFGLPLALLLSRSRSKIATLIDSLVDLSLVMPTAALGFSVYLYWGDKLGLGRLFNLENGLLDKGITMIILLHVVFTIPYIIRSIGASIAQIEPSFEEAAITLGAHPFTLFRTVSLPLFRDGVINGSILAFTRSLSETGATMMVAGLAGTAPVLVVELKNAGQMPQAIGLSIILVASAILVLLGAKAMLGQKAINLDCVYPRFERALGRLAGARNILLGFFFFFVVFLPTIFIIFYTLGNWESLLDASVVRSITISLVIALAVTVINLVFALPLAYVIARDRGWLGKIFDTLNEVVLLVPTSALGLSLVLYWQKILSFEYAILVLAHLSFSFPLLLKPLVASFRDISVSLEEAASSFGASSWQMMRSILFPLIIPALIAGSIMAFMRSLSETGATLAVSSRIQTVPVLIVDLVKAGREGEAAFVSSILFAVALFFLFTLKHFSYRKGK